MSDEKRDTRKRIGKHLQSLRKEAGYKSATAFAESVGYNPNTYTQYEQGLAGFSYIQAWEMADALHVSLDELGGRDWPQPVTAPLSVAPDEQALVDAYRSCTPREKAALSNMAETMADAGLSKNNPIPESGVMTA